MVLALNLGQPPSAVVVRLTRLTTAAGAFTFPAAAISSSLSSGGRRGLTGNAVTLLFTARLTSGQASAIQGTLAAPNSANLISAQLRAAFAHPSSGMPPSVASDLSTCTAALAPAAGGSGGGGGADSAAGASTSIAIAVSVALLVAACGGGLCYYFYTRKAAAKVAARGTPAAPAAALYQQPVATHPIAGYPQVDPSESMAAYSTPQGPPGMVVRSEDDPSTVAVMG
jgi:hypothetical protein